MWVEYSSWRMTCRDKGGGWLVGMEEEEVRMEWAIVMVTGGHLSVCCIWSADHLLYRTSQTLLLPLPRCFIWNSPGSVSSSALPTFLGWRLCSPSFCLLFLPASSALELTDTDWLTLHIPSGLKLEIWISNAHTISLISAALGVYTSENRKRTYTFLIKSGLF